MIAEPEGLDIQSARAMHPPFEPRRPIRPAPARGARAALTDRPVRHDVEVRDPGWSDAPWPDNLARSLALFSLALGAAELVAARDIAAWLGAPRRAGVVRACGVREIATGLALLGSHDPTARGRWLWARLAGDAADLGLLAAALHQGNDRRANVAGAMTAVAGVAALDLLAASLLGDR